MTNGSRAPLFDDRSRYLDRFGLLLAVTIAAIVMKSLVEVRTPSGQLESNAGVLVLAALVGAAFLLALRAAGLRRPWQRLADIGVLIGFVSVLLLVIVDAASDVDVLRYRRDVPPILRAAFGALTPIAVIWRVASHRRVTSGTLIGGISAYLLIALVFSDIFVAVDIAQSTPFFGEPESSTRFMYFSIVTLTTLGYGDLSPATDLGGLAANTEAIVGQLFLVTFIGLLVGLRIAGRLADEPSAPEEPSDS
jgi:voltage-gated potassium channel Kch